MSLYHEHAAKMPIIDYHCHLDPRQIAENHQFEDLTEIWLGGDHYKWRQMRSNGVDEYYITGEATDREKFQKWAETLELAIGNPLYHWSHLELKRYFGYEGYLNGETAEEVWNLCNEKLAQDDMTVRNIIKKSNVKLLYILIITNLDCRTISFCPSNLFCHKRLRLSLFLNVVL